jgi:vacuolar-type H+-ATPase subunit I/STV1
MNTINSLRNRLAQLDQEKASIINQLEQLVITRETEVNELKKVLEDSKQDTSEKDNIEATKKDDTLESAKKDLEQTYHSSEATEASPQTLRNKYLADIENNRTFINSPNCALSKLGKYLVNNYKGDEEQVLKLFNDVSFMAYYTPILDKVDTPKLISKLIDNWLDRSAIDLISELEIVEQNQNLGKEKNKARALIWYGLLKDKDEEVKDLISNKQFLSSFEIHHKTSPYSDTAINTIKKAVKGFGKSNAATPSS